MHTGRFRSRFRHLFSAFLVAGLSLPANAAPLFEDDAVIELTMHVSFESLCRPSEDPDCGWSPTEFRIHGDSGDDVTVDVSIRRRDGWRAQQTNCQVPTLFVRFDPDSAAGTPFEGQTELALTSHCGKGISPDNRPSRRLPDDFESYVINEYLGYRLYSLVTPAALQVRLVRITYADVENPRRDFTQYAFFSEHFDDLAERLGARRLPADQFDPRQLDLGAADNLAMFQYMIGNADWSIETQQNVELLAFPDGRQVPVLYDLDLSGLVDAHYATPPPGVPIASVRQRHYQGYCHEGANWDALFGRFNDLREPVLREVSATPGLGRGDRRMAGVYLESFFDILASPGLRQIGIVESCQALPQANG